VRISKNSSNVPPPSQERDLKVGHAGVRHIGATLRGNRKLDTGLATDRRALK
jgi:hypothetical protein